MTQALYAHMNNKKILKRKNLSKEEGWWSGSRNRPWAGM
jgi:hypothetical protein